MTPLDIGLAAGLWALAALAALMVLLAHLDPPQAPWRAHSACPHCSTRGRAAIHATGDEGLLWTCPRCGTHWTTEVE